MVTRLYVVSDMETEEMGGQRFLVEAQTSAQAIRHVVRQKYSAKAATPKQVAELMRKNVLIEKATSEEVTQ